MQRKHLEWPFFDAAHRTLADGLGTWAAATLHHVDDATREANDARCRSLVASLGAAGWTRYAVPEAYGGALDTLDSRALCIVRETLAYHDGLADFAFAMQGLGSGPITLSGSDTLKQTWLPRVASGDAIAAFALSEPDAGSDVAAMKTRAVADGDHYVIDGCKTWISNGGIADFYTVFARTSDEPGARGISAFVVDATTPGLTIADRIDVIAPHPLATLRFTACRVPATRLLGPVGQGFKVAMRTLDIFRASVAAAALGFARRAFDEAVTQARNRRMFGHTLADFQLTQATLADMATDIDATALLTYRAAWQRDVLQVNATREAAMAKLTATENAQRVIDRAVQLFGGAGVAKGNIVEALYREIRALRIYEGASEVQRLIIGRDLLKDAAVGMQKHAD
ncbi:MAG: acyl-CoA dehydrogenase family protein [Burkholderiaceae bacterium]